jgi:putative Holliday junction resolvase
MNKNEVRIMGIDYGEKRIGIALSDPLNIFAYPFKTINNDSNFWNDFSELVRDYKISIIILGLPSSKFTSSKKLADKVHVFKEEIIKKLKLEIILWDEEFTSAIAKEKILEAVTKKSKRRDKGLLDSFSATVILQEFLDSRQPV